MRTVRWFTVAIVLAGRLASIAGSETRGVTPRSLRRIYVLKDNESVFAYARISPSGRFLAYAAEGANPATARRDVVVNIVDLTSGRITFSEPGRDAYWSVDGRRVIFLSTRTVFPTVSIRHHDSGEIARNVAPAALGDYFSWGFRDGRQLVLTILGNYYYLDGDSGVAPEHRVPVCPGIGRGERPLLSKDGRRITTFVGGRIVVRNLSDCDDIVDTGIQGAKADFSFDGRYIAFHAPKPGLQGYEIRVVDLDRRTTRALRGLAGSSFFPSWTATGSLCFRYDGPDFRGFAIVHPETVWALPEEPLARVPPTVRPSLRWSDLFPGTAGAAGLSVLMIWAPWSAHSPDALADLQKLRGYLRSRLPGATVLTAIEAGPLAHDASAMLRRFDITVPAMAIPASRLALTEAINQIPATLVFRDGRLWDRRLGAQSYGELRDWIERMAAQ